MTTYSLVLFRKNDEEIVLQTGMTYEEVTRYTNSNDTSGDGWFMGLRTEEE